MPILSVTISTGALERVKAAGTAAGYIDGPTYLKALLQAAVLNYERGNAAALAVNQSDTSVIADFTT